MKEKAIPVWRWLFADKSNRTFLISLEGEETIMQALRAGWDFFQNEVLGMKWLSRLIGSAVEAVGLDPAGQVGGTLI